ERTSDPGGLLPADRAGPGSDRAAEGARADVHHGSRVRVSAGDGAPAHGGHRGRTEAYRSNFPRRRVRRRASADGDRVSRAEGRPFGEDGTRTGGPDESNVADRSFAVRSEEHTSELQSRGH